MNSEIVNNFFKGMSAYTLIIWITFIIFLIGGLIAIGGRLYKFIEKYRTQRNKAEDKDKKIESLEESVSEIKMWSKAQCVALKVLLANELDRKYRYYLQLKYIPDKEFDEYVDMHSAYKGLGGNHHGDEKYEYVMDHLERKVDE